MDVVKYTHNSAGMRELLISLGVEKMLHGRAERVAEAAQAHYDSEDQPHTGEVVVEVDSGVGPGRVHATVVAKHPAALAIEARHRILGGAIDAAGGGP